jgi:hypothetical protein
MPVPYFPLGDNAMTMLTYGYYIGPLIKQFFITSRRYEVMNLKAYFILTYTAAITSGLLLQYSPSQLPPFGSMI